MAPRRGPAPSLILVLLFLAGLLLRGQMWTGSGIDEVHYFAPAASLVWDGDLELTNDLLEARTDYTLRRRVAQNIWRDGRPDLPFALGLSLFSAPQLAVGRAADAASGGWLGSNNRYTWFHRSAPTIATWLAVLAGLLALQRLGERYCSPWRAFCLCLVIFLCSNITFYLWNASAMAHAAGFGLAGVLVLSAVRYAEAPSPARALAAGLLTGFAFLLRWQEVLLGAIPAVALIVALRAGRTPRLAARDGLLMVAGALAAALPQFVFWRLMFGQWALLPQGAGFFTWDWSRPALVLFSPLNGWLMVHPAMGLLLLAFVPAWRSGPRWLWGAALAVILVAVLVNSLPGDWWAGGSFGARRFAATQALLMVPAAMAASRLSRRAFVAWMAIFAALALANLLVLVRWTHSATPVFLWSSVANDLPAWLRFPFSGREALCSSDLFSLPAATDHSRRVRALFLIAIAATGAAALAALQAFRHPGIRVALRLPALALAVAAPVVFALLLTGADRPWSGPVAGWSMAASDALRRDDDRTLRARAVRRRTDPGFQGMVDVYRLEEALLRGRDTEALSLTEKLRPLLPRTVLDAWAGCSPIDSSLRNEWLPRLRDVPDPSAPTLEKLYQEACALRRAEDIRLLSERLGGTRARRDLRALQRDFWGGAPARKLRRRADAAMRSNPFGTAAPMEAIRLRQFDPPRAEPFLGRVMTVTAEYLAAARLVHEWHPAEWGAFEPGWRSAARQRVEALELIGRTKEAREELRRAEALGLSPDMVASAEARLDEAEQVEAWMAGSPETPYPSGMETLIPEVPPEARASVNPQWLRRSDGWGVLESTAGQIPWRWTYSEVSFLRLSAPIPPGRHRIKLYCYTFPADRFRTPVSLELYGEERSAEPFVVPGGHFWYETEIIASTTHHRPLLRLCHPLAPINAWHTDSTDTRRVGLMFYVAWVE